MELKHLVSLAGIDCPTEADVTFNDWFDAEHLPLGMSFKELLGVTLYRIVRYGVTVLVKDYPRYVLSYRFADAATLRAWNASPQLDSASNGWRGACKAAGVRLAWSAQYGCVQTWQRTLPHSAIIIVGVQCPASVEAAFDQWHTAKHIPDLLKFKGLQGVTRYKLVGREALALDNPPSAPPTDFPGTLGFYHFDNTFNFGHQRMTDAYDDSEERKEAHRDFAIVAAQLGVVLLWRAEYEPVKTWSRKL